jgi:ribosomal protein S18 acetylase RimI-like enzyme
MGDALRRRFFAVGWTVLSSLIRSPRRVVAVWELVALLASTPSLEASDREGELLSMGVREEFRSPEFVESTGLHVAHDLVESVIAPLKATGRRRVRAIVDADNVAAKLFYHGLGWSLNRVGVPGWRAETVEFVLEI